MNELGTFLRARRARVTPAEAGLPPGRRRRTPGLRREEMAALVDVSVDYYTRLEQGRETRPSGRLVRALQTALRLRPDECAHLDALVLNASGAQVRREEASTDVPESMRLMLEAVRPSPAYLLSRVSDVLAANAEGLALLPGIADWPREKWNTIRYVFTHPVAPSYLGDWAKSCADNVAHLRSVLTADPGAPDVAALVAELSAHSGRFAELWERYDVQRWTGRTKTFRHPGLGDLVLTSETLSLPEGGRRLVVYQAEPGSPTRQAIERLAAGD